MYKAASTVLVSKYFPAQVFILTPLHSKSHKNGQEHICIYQSPIQRLFMWYEQHEHIAT